MTYTITTRTADNQLKGSLYQKVNNTLETGILVNFPFGSNTKGTHFQYAMNYELDSSHRLQVKLPKIFYWTALTWVSITQAKVNTMGQMSVSVSKNFGSGIIISLCGLLDGKNIKGGAHKMGMGIEMDI